MSTLSNETKNSYIFVIYGYALIAFAKYGQTLFLDPFRNYTFKAYSQTIEFLAEPSELRKIFMRGAWSIDQFVTVIDTDYPGDIVKWVENAF